MANKQHYTSDLKPRFRLECVDGLLIGNSFDFLYSYILFVPHKRQSKNEILLRLSNLLFINEFGGINNLI